MGRGGLGNSGRCRWSGRWCTGSPRGSGRAALTASLRQLAVGDSFAVDRDRRAALSVAVTREQMRNGTRFTTRLCLPVALG
jgi:hypothetical protein